MRLLRSEFLRARSRRLVWMVLAGGVVATVVALGILAFNSSSPSQADLDATQQTQQQQLERCLRGNTFGRDGSYPPEYDSLEEAVAAQQEFAELHAKHWPECTMVATLRQISEAPPEASDA